jgi:hypothetical protein
MTSIFYRIEENPLLLLGLIIWVVWSTGYLVQTLTMTYAGEAKDFCGLILGLVALLGIMIPYAVLGHSLGRVKSSTEEETIIEEVKEKEEEK